MISIIIILLFQILTRLPNVQSSIGSSYDEEETIRFETHTRRRTSPQTTCLVENSTSPANDFTATTSCTQANIGETCTYSCNPPYFLDNLIPSMLTSRIPGFGDELIVLNPSFRYCSEKETSPGLRRAEWFQPVGEAYKQPQCLSQDVHDKLILCTNESSYNAYACHAMRACFIQDEIGVNCTTLDFSGPNNVLYSLYEGFFGSTPNVEEVDFTSNYLGLEDESLAPDVFQPIKETLKNLIMSDNYVGELNGILKGLEVIHKISFSNNVLTNLESDAFQGSSTLVLLELDNNRIVSIENGAFANLENLEMLYLEGNYLKILNATIFQGQLSQNLKLLDLSSNRIMYFHPDTFVGLSSLRKLLLSKNSLTKIEPRSFATLNLVRLSLDNNNIHSLMSGIFDEINIRENTGEIDLSDNPIIEIYNNSIQSVLCTTARFVLSTQGTFGVSLFLPKSDNTLTHTHTHTKGTSYCGCKGTGPDASIFCHCRAGSVGLNDDATSMTPYACRIPIITDVGVNCNPSREMNGCDSNDLTTSGHLLSM